MLSIFIISGALGAVCVIALTVALGVAVHCSNIYT
jgi:hypothetical protein